MSRYIDADLALELKYESMNCVYDLTDLEEFLEGVPTADVAPVRHGEWLYTSFELAEMACSLCGFTYYGEHDIECMSAFCPECGAKMDGERRSENDG